eukprot:scaffold808_cov370-Prasinococcus_capsulatus_cf.AAC.2
MRYGGAAGRQRHMAACLMPPLLLILLVLLMLPPRPAGAQDDEPGDSPQSQGVQDGDDGVASGTSSQNSLVALDTVPPVECPSGSSHRAPAAAKSFLRRAADWAGQVLDCEPCLQREGLRVVGLLHGMRGDPTWREFRVRPQSDRQSITLGRPSANAPP